LVTGGTAYAAPAVKKTAAAVRAANLVILAILWTPYFSSYINHPHTIWFAGN
jgi:hypothetical protein